MLLGVDGLDADAHAQRDRLGFEPFAVVQRDELAVLLRELGQDLAHHSDLLAKHADVVRIGQLGRERLGLAQGAALGFALDGPQKVVGGVDGQHADPAAELVAAAWLEAAQLALVVCQELHAEHGVDLADVVGADHGRESRCDPGDAPVDEPRVAVVEVAPGALLVGDHAGEQSRLVRGLARISGGHGGRAGELGGHHFRLLLVANRHRAHRVPTNFRVRSCG